VTHSDAQPAAGRRAIGRQIMLPFSRAFEIAWKGIKIRIWRSLITMSGIILAIAFLMSVWTGGVFNRALAQVPPDDKLYALVQGVLEAEAIAGGGVHIRCAVVEPYEATAVAGQRGITPGGSIRDFLDSQKAFSADLVPAEAPGTLEMLTARREDRPDVVVLAGPSPAFSTPEAVSGLTRFVREGGALLIYGPVDGADALKALLPAVPTGGTVEVSAGGVKGTRYAAAVHVAWQSHPKAAFAAAQGAEGAVALAEADGEGIAWFRALGRGAVAWYPVQAEYLADADVLSWFTRGQPLAGAGAADPQSSLMVRVIAHSVSGMLRGARSDTRGLWLVGLSLLVCVVGITNAMLMSVTERFREIGTMKCLGALDRFVVKLFLIESSLQGMAGSLAGVLIGFLLAFARALFMFHVRDPQTGQGYWLALDFFPGFGILVSAAVALVAGMVLSVVAAVYPAIRAARMEPVQAMRAEA